MKLPVHLCRSVELETAPTAWFLPGENLEGWLEELSRCGLATLETRLFVVPNSLANRTCAGLLVIPGPSWAGASYPAGLPCRCLAGCLYVPSDATLSPPLTDQELQAWCPAPLCFLHPALGLAGFSSADALHAGELLQPPREVEAEWNWAQPRPPGLPEFVGISLSRPPSLESLFGEAPQEIGAAPASDLPPTPEEPRPNRLKDPARQLGRQALGGLAKALGALPQTAAGRNWLRRLEQWANRRPAPPSEDLEARRNQEIKRLLHLLDSDPETGLRHALPMNHFPARGQAPPSARLGERPPVLDPRRLGGGPADYWKVEISVQEDLRRRYRALAARETQLGRYRRAAYIYAELLGDLASAAIALKQGRFFRDAALLYEEHLKNPSEAARCLAEAGLLDEAIERFERLGLWLDAADLHERAGHEAAANAALRRVVADRLRRGDHLAAAKLVEERLKAPDEAFDLLWQAWPQTPQAATCLGAALNLLGRLGRGEAALDRLQQIARGSTPSEMAAPLANVLGEVARSFPHPVVQRRAADLARVVIADRLSHPPLPPLSHRPLGPLSRPRLPKGETRNIVSELVRLAPEDRLLIRDASRFLAERERVEAPFLPPTPPAFGNTPHPFRGFVLGRRIKWRELRWERRWFFALGVTPTKLIAIRGRWDGNFQTLSWDYPADELKRGLVFAVRSEPTPAVALRTNGPAVPVKAFPAADLFAGEECPIGAFPWLPMEGALFTFGDGIAWSAHVAAGRTIISCHNHLFSQLLRTVDVTSALLDGAESAAATRLCLAATRHGAALAMGNRMVILPGVGDPVRVDLPGQVIGLTPTPPHTRPGIAVTLEVGACVHWMGMHGCVVLDESLPSPLAAFVRSGPLVLASRHRAIMLEVDHRGIHRASPLELPGFCPVGLCATNEPYEFAILDEGGEVTVIRTSNGR